MGGGEEVAIEQNKSVSRPEVTVEMQMEEELQRSELVYVRQDKAEGEYEVKEKLVRELVVCGVGVARLHVRRQAPGQPTKNLKGSQDARIAYIIIRN